MQRKKIDYADAAIKFGREAGDLHDRLMAATEMINLRELDDETKSVQDFVVKSLSRYRAQAARFIRRAKKDYSGVASALSLEHDIREQLAALEQAVGRYNKCLGPVCYN